MEYDNKLVKLFHCMQSQAWFSSILNNQKDLDQKQLKNINYNSNTLVKSTQFILPYLYQ